MTNRTQPGLFNELIKIIQHINYLRDYSCENKCRHILSVSICQSYRLNLFSSAVREQAGRSVRTCSVRLFLRTEALRAQRLESDGSRESGETDGQAQQEESRDPRPETRELRAERTISCAPLTR